MQSSPPPSSSSSAVSSLYDLWGIGDGGGEGTWGGGSSMSMNEPSTRDTRSSQLSVNSEPFRFFGESESTPIQPPSTHTMSSGKGREVGTRPRAMGAPMGHPATNGNQWEALLSDPFPGGPLDPLRPIDKGAKSDYSSDAMGLGMSAPRSHAPGHTLKSKGRTNPILGQAEIVERMGINNLLYEERMKTPIDQCIAPVGGREAFEIHEGAMLWGIAGRTGPRVSCNGYPDVYVFEHLGGLRKGTRIFWAGQMKNRAGIDTNEMSVVTSTVAGSLSTVNNGPDTMCPNDPIYFSTVLWTAGSGRNIRPTVEIYSEPKDKWTPVLRVFYETDICALRETVVERQSSYYLEFDEKTPPERVVRTMTDAASVTAYYNGLAARSRHYFAEMGHFRSEQPIHVWALWQALCTTLRIMAMEFFEIESKETLTACQAIVKEIVAEERNCYDYDTRTDEAYKVMGAYTSDAGQAALLVTDDANLQKFIMIKALPLFCESRRDIALMEHSAFMRTHIIGTASTYAPPGSQVDMRAGYHNH